jgi:DNA ligase 1
MVGKYFKGLTDDVLGWQTTALLERETERRGIAVLVRPGWSSRSRSMGSSPRPVIRAAWRCGSHALSYRPDKRANEADTIDDLLGLLRARS